MERLRFSSLELNRFLAGLLAGFCIEEYLWAGGRKCKFQNPVRVAWVGRLASIE
jgi:hypothetical protein